MVAIARLELEVMTTQQKPELASGVLDEADSPLSFWILDTEALMLDSDGCGHVLSKVTSEQCLVHWSLESVLSSGRVQGATSAPKA